MDSRIVSQELRAAIRPFLQTHGFAAFTTRTAWRYRPGRVEIVNFQSFNDYVARGVGCTTYSFAVNLGICLLAVPPAQHHDSPKKKDGSLRPEPWQCHLQLPLHRTMEQPELPRTDIWYVDERGHYLSSAVRDARDVIANRGLLWFERWTDGAVLAELLSERVLPSDDTRLPGNPGSLTRHYVAGYLAWHAGDRALAAQLLRAALEQYEHFDAINAKTSKRHVPRTPMRLRADLDALRAAV